MFDKLNNNIVHMKYNQDMIENSVIEHYESKVEPFNIFYIVPIENINCSFLYLKTNDNQEYLYYFGKELNNEVLIPSYINSDNKYVYSIDLSNREYCIEIKLTYPDIY